MILRIMIGMILVGSLTGCATTRQPTAVNQLQISVAQIENRLDEQNREMAELRFNVEDLAMRVQRAGGGSKLPAVREKTVQTSSPEESKSERLTVLRVPVAPKEVQMALQNAGYYKGTIDGKLGSGSQRAIKEFQNDHNLKSDGVVGKKTWEALQRYLE